MRWSLRRKSIYTKDLLKRKDCTVGDHTYGLPRVATYESEARLVIGRYCSIAHRVTIFLGGNHRSDWVTTYPFPRYARQWPEAAGIRGYHTTRGDVLIGNDVWIGYGATILSGVTVGDGAVIGARALVAADVPPYGIVAGNPAALLRKRFDEDRIARLLALRWWDWPEDKIRRHLPRLCSADLDGFLDAV
jgi:acetyltransferase-like isoleucine patch superfamily enzyme